MKKVVIALGGNALLKKGEEATIATQIKNTKKAMEELFPIIDKYDTVITHGNGPQAGYLMLQQEAAKNKVAKAPLDVIDAETEGQIGYIIQQRLLNLYNKKGKFANIVTILTQVLVDKKDHAFKNPSKFVGPFYTESEAKKLRKKFIIKKDSNRGFRRVVPSPLPLEIIESDAIMTMLHEGMVVIAAGGGGIPVIKKGKKLHGVEAVIDKDLASACLAYSIDADTLIIITDVDGVYLSYGTVQQQRINKAYSSEMKNLFEQGHFPPGNMGPKVSAAISFLDEGGKEVIITNIDNIQKALKGKAGTKILR